MCGAAASCSIALNVCQILEIDLEKLLRGGNSILGRLRTARATHPPGVERLSVNEMTSPQSHQQDKRSQLA